MAMERRTGFARDRLLRKRELLEYIVNFDKKKRPSSKDADAADQLEYDRVAGFFSWKWGITARKVEVMLDELQRAGAIIMTGSKIESTPTAELLLKIR